MKKAYYIAELNLPNNSAYAQHVLKMCDALAKNFRTTLFVLNSNINFKKLKKYYFLKNKFEIYSINKKKTKNNDFFSRIKFAFLVKKKLKSETLIISRSIITSLVLSICSINNFLEIHHNLKSFTKLFFNTVKQTKYFKFIYFILINKSLIKVLNLNEKFIVLDDAVDIDDFKRLKKQKNKYQFTYAGSLYEGKGLEIIHKLAKKFTKSKFHIFGYDQNINKKIFKKNKNLHFHGFVNYCDLVKILKQSKYLLMPYSKKINVNSDNLEISKYISPLKLFQYMASKKIIIASNLSAYKHILKHNFNCVLCNPNDIQDWENKISNLNNFNSKKIINNCYKSVLKYTWNRRVKKIIEIHNEQ